ncbi:hypothetical protein [Falsiroseomonas sp. HW251]|uniref:hypothetical protein n=1 Tax=Falsiroseomonas sp. HW251 TaxID=3390998 RepID=UPI003D3240E0
MRAVLVAVLLALGLPALAQGTKDAPPGQAAPPSQPQAQAPAPAPGQRTPMAIVTALPQEILGFRRDGDPVDYESRSPGLGASVNYRRIGGAGLVTVYVYDGYTPPRRLADGVRAEEVAAHLRSAGNEIVQAAQQRGTKLTGPVEVAAAPGPTGQPAMRCQRWGMLLDNGETAESHLCLGVLQGRLLKLRVTQPPVPATRDAEVAAFGAAVVRALVGAPGGK